MREFQIALLLSEPPEGFTPDETALKVEGVAIDALAARSGDTSAWHTRPGAPYRESPLLATRMRGGAIDPEARLAHGLMALVLALRTAYQSDRQAAIRGCSNVRYTTPVFEGATLAAQVEPPVEGSGGFVVTTDQLQPDLALTGRLHYGTVSERHDPAFSSPAEQQLYSLEEAAGMASALIGLGAEQDGLRALLIGQRLDLLEPVAVGDDLQVATEIVNRAVTGSGERVTANVGVVRRGPREGLVALSEVTVFLLRPDPC